MASEAVTVTRSPKRRLRSSSAKGLVRLEPANQSATRARKAGSWPRRFVACGNRHGDDENGGHHESGENDRDAQTPAHAPLFEPPDRRTYGADDNESCHEYQNHR